MHHLIIMRLKLHGFWFPIQNTFNACHDQTTERCHQVKIPLIIFVSRALSSTFMSIPLCFPWLVWKFSYSCSVLLQLSSTITQLKLTSLCIVKLYTTQSLQVNNNIFYSFISLHMINDWLNNMDKCFNNCAFVMCLQG
jgi:hypothetical protein